MLDHKELEKRAGIATTRDLLETIPNLALSVTGNAAPVIRGVDGTGAAQGADAFFAGSRPRLNVQIDGRALSYNEIVFGDNAIWDVQQVEVLRGAQSRARCKGAMPLRARSSPKPKIRRSNTKALCVLPAAITISNARPAW